jgi:uncharacterized protein (TIGR00303 family)
LGFTATGLIPGISAAGATPEDRRYTAIADAEFLVQGVVSQPKYQLPPLIVGVSPVFITRAVVEALEIPVYLFNAGLPVPPVVPTIDLGGLPADCVTTGKALPFATVEHLFEQGLLWGEKLAQAARGSYVMIGECVVGGTTTALSLLLGLGISAMGKVNSSHPNCNHAQKIILVEQGLARAGLLNLGVRMNPFSIVAAVGDPMQIVAAGMAIAASRRVGVMLTGGTQMLAVYALIQAIQAYFSERIGSEQILIGTTPWVANDPTGDTIGLAAMIPSVSLLALNLSFATSRYPTLQVYERGYVKEGVGAGGCAIASHLFQGWTPIQLLHQVEALLDRYDRQLRNESDR